MRYLLLALQVAIPHSRNMPDKNLARLNQKNLLHAIKSIIGSELFRHLYVQNQTTGQEVDAVDDGQLSCAFTVSSLLTLQGLIDRPHATVATTLAKMQKAGWYKIAEPRPGAVVQWPARDGHEHVGFVLEENICVSNSDRKRTPVEHPLKLYDGREPSAFYWHDELDSFTTRLKE